MKKMKKNLKNLAWKNSDVFENVKNLGEAVQEVQHKIDKDPHNHDLRSDEAGTLKAYTEAMKEEELILYQKTKVKWLSVGDRNNAYFYKAIKSRQQRNRIDAICDKNGSRVEGGENKLSKKDVMAMIREVTNEEINQAMFKIDDNKAPGPNEFSTHFLKKAWRINGKDVYEAVKEFFVNGKILRKINSTLIALVPKIQTPLKISYFKPIACCNVIYKCISKIHTERLKWCLDKLLSKNQSAFFPKRHIQNNIMLAQELFNGYDRKVGPKRVALKVDIQKAYDTVNWQFLKDILKGFGFHDKMVDWIMTCVTTTSFYICVNGESCGYFKGGRGFRQGDPNSLYLFTLIMEILTPMIKRRVESSSNFQYHFGCKKLKITSVCFADDLLMFFHADRSFVKTLKESIEEFVARPEPNVPLRANLGVLHLKFLRRMYVDSSKKEVNTKKLKGKSIWEIEEDKNDSWGWRNLLKQRNDVRGFIVSKLKNREKVSLWFNNWSNIAPLDQFINYKAMYDGRFRSNLIVKEWIEENHGMWPDGHAYKNLIADEDDVDWWKVVWYSQNIPKHAFVVWLAGQNKITTQDKIKQWGSYDVLCCFLCKNDSDSHSHLFFECGDERRNSEELAKAIIDVVRMRLLSLKFKKTDVVIKAQDIWDVKMCIVNTLIKGGLDGLGRILSLYVEKMKFMHRWMYHKEVRLVILEGMCFYPNDVCRLLLDQFSDAVDAVMFWTFKALPRGLLTTVLCLPDFFKGLDLQPLRNFLAISLFSKLPKGMVIFVTLFVVVTKSEYLRFPFLSGASITRGATVPVNHPVGQNTTPLLPVDQPIPDKTDSQREVEIKDAKVVAVREKKKPKWQGPQQRKKIARKEEMTQKGVLERRRKECRKVAQCQNEDEEPHGLNDEGQPIHPLKEPVFVSEANVGGSSYPLNTLSTDALVSQPREILTGESSRSAFVYVPKWNIPLRCHVDTPEWCRELMVHLAHSAAQEESNALTNEVALQRDWFNVAQGDMAQTDMLERFENLLDDYDNLAEAHAECPAVWKLVFARVDLEHNAKRYTNAIKHLRTVREEHAGLVGRLLKSHEYKESHSRPFNMANQVGWGKGLSEGCKDEEIIAVLHKAKDFDPYSDKKLYPMYDKLFEKEYPYWFGFNPFGEIIDCHNYIFDPFGSLREGPEDVHVPLVERSWGHDGSHEGFGQRGHYSVKAPFGGVTDWYQSQSVGSHAPRVILFGVIPTIIHEVPVVSADPLVAPEDSLPHVPELPLVSLFLCSDNSEADSESEPAKQRPERHESLAAHDAMVSSWRDRVASRTSSPPGSSSHDTLAPSSDFSLSPVVSPPRIRRRPSILVRPGEAIPFTRPYRTHINRPRKLLNARKRVGPFHACRLAW
nr:RNA-directed DNA polymerase, eukaryota, reverse transcriptase zinc-binding domain protein [Tanacetum cinerariifolium]